MSSQHGGANRVSHAYRRSSSLTPVWSDVMFRIPTVQRVRLKGVLQTAVLAMLAAACYHAGAARAGEAQLPDSFWENTEGIRDDGAPPLFRAARTPDLALLARHRSTLVVHVMRG